MPEVKYGELADWNEGEVSTPNDFMNLVEGNNQVRVITNPYQFIVHWVKDNSGVNRKIKCAIDNCPLCKRGIKSQYRWYIGVIDRASGDQPKVLEISSQVYKGIKDYINVPEWGDIRQYDVNIKRGPKGSQPLYTVIGMPKTPLTQVEKELIVNFRERVQIEKFTQPPTAEEVSEKIGAAHDEPAKVAVGTQTVETSAAGVKPTVNDEEFNFGDDEL
jgi:hypothetical protein